MQYLNRVKKRSLAQNPPLAGPQAGDVLGAVGVVPPPVQHWCTKHAHNQVQLPPIDGWKMRGLMDCTSTPSWAKSTS
jgi:hypothetical protein